MSTLFSWKRFTLELILTIMFGITIAAVIKPVTGMPFEQNLVWSTSYSLSILFSNVAISQFCGWSRNFHINSAVALFLGILTGTICAVYLENIIFQNQQKIELVIALHVALVFGAIGSLYYSLIQEFNTSRRQLASEITASENYLKDAAEAQQQLLSARIQPTVLIGELEEAVCLLKNGKTLVARRLLENLASRLRDAMRNAVVVDNSHGFADGKQFEELYLPAKLKVGEFNLRSALLTYITWEIFLLVVTLAETTILPFPAMKVAFWVHCVGYSILISAYAIAYFAKRPLYDVWTLACAIIIGDVVGKALAGWFMMGNPWFMLQDASGRFVLPFSLFFSFSGVYLMYLWARWFNSRADVIEAKLTKDSEARRLTQTRLRLLQAQIEPHFIFNTLSNIIAHAESKPDVATSMLRLLSNLLQLSISRTKERLTTLGGELNIVSTYLEIQSLRMGNKLEWRVDCNSLLRDTPIPPLLIQPLVENAVCHGVEPSPIKCLIEICIYCERDGILIIVRDTGIGLNMTGKSGIGLSNIRARLNYEYGKQASLLILPILPRGVEARIHFPLGLQAG